MADFERTGPVCAGLKADSVGGRVPACGCGVVHSVFARACNIEMHGGELVTLLASGLGAAPHGIRLEAQSQYFNAWLRTGQNAILDDAVLLLPDAGIAVDLFAASQWRGAVSSSVDSRGATVRLLALRDMVCERAPRQGIAPALLQPAAAMTSLDRAFASRLLNLLPMLARAARCRDIAGMAVLAESLVGLGPGLTPAGDDFLTGWLAALWSRAACDSEMSAMLPPLGAAFAPVFRRTNAISRQMLEDAAHGYFAQALAEVTGAVFGAGDITHASERALASGHSSGADALCGLLFGYEPGMLLRADDRGAAMRPPPGSGGTIAPIRSH